MALKTYNPVTPSQRQLVLVDRSGLYRGAPVKSLTEGKSSSGGRNNNGRITVRFRGGGHKKAYRKIDFKRRKFDVPAKVERIEYDPNRTGFIALIKYEDGELAYILAPQRLSPGRHDRLRRARRTSSRATPCRSATSRSARSCTTSRSRSARADRSRARPAPMPRSSAATATTSSCGSTRPSSGSCTAAAWATIGAVSNPDNMNISIGKAGRKRWMGRMPHNRGVTMNPIDHPHGGGEGRTSGGRHPVTPWGFPTKGKKTRKNKSTTKFIISSRHARKKK